MTSWIFAIAVGLGVFVVLRFAVGKERLRERLGMSADSNMLPGGVIAIIGLGAAVASVLAAASGDLLLILAALVLWAAFASLLLRFARQR